MSQTSNNMISNKDYDANHYYQQGIKLQQSNNLTDAEKSFRQAINLQPNNHHHHHKLGDNLKKQNQLGEAINSYQKSIELKPDFFWSYHSWAMCLLWQGKYQDTVDIITKAIAFNSKVPASFDILGRALYYLNRNQEAVEAFQAAINLDPDLAAAHHNLGDALAVQSKFDAAIAAYTKAIELNPESFWSYVGLGKTLTGCSKYELATYFYHQALKINPNSAQVYAGLAQLEQKKENIDRAAEYYQQALTLDPTWELPYIMLQYLPVDDNRRDKLIDFYRQITQKHPEAKLAWGNLGDTLSDKRELEEAIKCYQNFCYQNTIAAQPQLAKLDWKPRKEIGPDFIIIGAGKCGTSSLHKYICKHPQVLAPHKKELNFFRNNFDKGVDWYLSHFPSITDSKDYITGEASPVYFHASHVDQRIHSLFPKTKLIVLLRNPVERAVSWHYHKEKWQLNKSKTTPEVSINKAIAVLDNSSEEDLAYGGGHILESLYYYKLKRWMSLFSKEQFLILKSEDLFSQPSMVMNQTFDFLGLPAYESSHYVKHNGGLYVPIEDKFRQYLSEYFKPYNQKLEQYLDRSFNWD